MGITEAKQRFGAPRFIDKVKEHSAREEEIKLFQRIETARASYLLLRLTEPDYQDPEFVAFLSKESAADFLVDSMYAPGVDVDNLITAVNYGREAMNEVIRKNRDLANKIAGKYFKYCHEFKIPSIDILGQAMEGLAEAAVRFDYRKNTKFSTFAFIFIRKKIINFLREIINPNDWDKIRNHEQSFNRIAQKLGHTPVRKDFPDGKEQKIYDFVAQLNSFFHPATIENPVVKADLADGGEGDLLSSFIPDSTVDVSETAIKLIVRKSLRAVFYAQLRGKEVIPGLTKREITTLCLRHGFDQGGDERTLEEVGQKLRLSHTAVGNILEEAYKKLQRSKELKELFELAFG